MPNTYVAFPELQCHPEHADMLRAARVVLGGIFHYCSPKEQQVRTHSKKWNVRGSNACKHCLAITKYRTCHVLRTDEQKVEITKHYCTLNPKP